MFLNNSYEKEGGRVKLILKKFEKERDLKMISN